MANNPQHGDRPAVACEIGVDRVIAARADSRSGGIEMHTTRRLPTGCIVPSLTAGNIINKDALRQAMQGALGSIAGAGRDVIAILPDNAVRLVLVDFDSLPTDRAEADPIIRFRLRKALPFDADDAALSYSANRSQGNVKVVAALTPRTVLNEYEEAFRDAGYEPGVVMPSIVATLGLVETDRPAMVVKVDPNTTTIAIADEDELHLLRTLEHPGRSTVTAEELAENLYPSMVFFEDSYSSKLDRVLLSGMAYTPGMANALTSAIGIRTEEIGSSRSYGEGLADAIPAAMLSGVAGALLA